MPQLGLGLGIQKRQNNGGGPPAPWTDDYSYQFNGVDQYFATPDDPVLNITTELTISAWCKATASPPTGDGYIVDKFTTTGYALLHDLYFGNGRWAIYIGTTAGISRLRSSGTTTAGVWTHVAATYDSVTGNLELYINGAPDASMNAGAGNLLATNTVPLCLAHADNVLPPTGMYDGKLDEIAVWDVAMSPAEIASIYNAGSPDDLAIHPQAGNGVIWYRMGEGATWNGTDWLMPNAFNPGSNVATSDAMVFADRTTDVP